MSWVTHRPAEPCISPFVYDDTSRLSFSALNFITCSRLGIIGGAWSSSQKPRSTLHPHAQTARQQHQEAVLTG